MTVSELRALLNKVPENMTAEEFDELPEDIDGNVEFQNLAYAECNEFFNEDDTETFKIFLLS